ncbi:MAG: GTP-binding protein [Oscillospiraceae bacterium]|nr:GTP-binding protein [Oscillospiraceae bacterium]
MVKIDIFSGFLGAGKTTLIRKLITEAYAGEKIVLVENEFGDVGVDGAFLQDAGVEVTEMNSGCICCSLSGDFSQSLRMVMEQFAPERILIEPSGVGKLSDVIKAVEDAGVEELVINGLTVVADAKKCKVYMRNFGEFYRNQLEHAGCVVLSRTADIQAEKLQEAIGLIRSCNEKAVIVTTPWDQITGAQILEAMEKKDTLEEAVKQLAALEDECDDPDCQCHHHHGHHHHHHDHEGECCCHEEHEHHHHDHEGECCCHEEHEHHHHHDHEGECCCHEEHEHHHHDHDDECCCHGEHEHHHHHGHHHHHHHGHDADEVFMSWGAETAKVFTREALEAALDALDTEKYGVVLRCKGAVQGEDGWIHFDYVPEEKNMRSGAACVTGRLCVIGSKLDESGLKALFGV